MSLCFDLFSSHDICVVNDLSSDVFAGMSEKKTTDILQISDLISAFTLSKNSWRDVEYINAIHRHQFCSGYHRWILHYRVHRESIGLSTRLFTLRIHVETKKNNVLEMYAVTPKLGYILGDGSGIF